MNADEDKESSRITNSLTSVTRALSSITKVLARVTKTFTRVTIVFTRVTNALARITVRFTRVTKVLTRITKTHTRVTNSITNEAKTNAFVMRVFASAAHSVWAAAFYRATAHKPHVRDRPLNPPSARVDDWRMVYTTPAMTNAERQAKFRASHPGYAKRYRYVASKAALAAARAAALAAAGVDLPRDTAVPVQLTLWPLGAGE
jgi:hypothetical protein